MDENCQLHLWVVAEFTTADQAGSTSDLGLAPGGRVKLIKSNTIRLQNPYRDFRSENPMKAFDLQLLPGDNSHFYVGTDTVHKNVQMIIVLSTVISYGGNLNSELALGGSLIH